VAQLDVVLVGRSLRTLADQIPKRVARHLMGDHRDRRTRGVRRPGTHTAARLLGLTPVPEQAPSKAITAAPAAMAATWRGLRRVAADGRLRAYFIAILSFCVWGRLWKRACVRGRFHDSWNGLAGRL